MKRFVVAIITIIPVILVNEFSSFMLGPYLIEKGLMPREVSVVTMYGIATLVFGVILGSAYEKHDKKIRDTKESE